MPSNGKFPEHTVLISGSGSIGRRHLRNLHALGVRHLNACDPNLDRLEPMAAELGVRPFADFETALIKVKPELVFICTPPVFHVSQALRALHANAHVFIEKPLSHTLDDVDELIAVAAVRRRIVQVGYNLRFHPGLRQVKQLLDDEVIGPVLWARAEFGQYLPDWRPWQDYRQSYTARRALGGGIILDASHELDYLIYLLGRPTELVCMADKVSRLEVDVEDSATILLRFANGVRADVHLDFVQLGYARSCKLVGEQGTIFWDYPANQIRIYQAATDSWETLAYTYDSNEMYRAEVQHFLRCVEQGVSPAVDLKQASLVLKVALSAKSVAEQGELEITLW